jgi:ribosomal protein L16/L10AE
MNFKNFHKMPISGKMPTSTLRYGTLGLKFLENGEVTPEQLDAVRKLFFSVFKKYVKV